MATPLELLATLNFARLIGSGCWAIYMSTDWYILSDIATELQKGNDPQEVAEI
jgi:hypothetical protein